MAEYIDREALRKILENWRDAHADVDDEEGCGLLEDVIWEVDAQPAADVASVVHGRWNVVEGRRLDNAICSNCGRRFQAYYEAYRFCPNCGAKMDGGAEK